MLAAGLDARFGRASLVAPGGPVVSLTSFDPRLRSAHLTIASIGRGRVRPARIILWLDELDHVAMPVPTLARLRRRGLELRHCVDHGPHKKYLPYVSSVAHHTVPMVTADDDVLYPRRWLETLLADHLIRPDAVFAHRVNRITVRAGRVEPYVAWERALDRRATPRNYAVGIKGVLYPPQLLDALRDAGDGFVGVAPASSDTWLHHRSLAAGVVTLPTLALHGRGFTPIRGVARAPALFEQNVDAGRNDRVRAALLTPDQVRAIVEDDWESIATACRIHM
jgi:hypothetical protein